MGIFKRILAPTDLSDLSATGVRYATQLARDVGAELIIFNVMTLDETNTVDKHDLERHRTNLDRFVSDKVADIGGNIQIRKIVDAGDAYGAILDCADNEHVDLIIMSSHGRSGLSRMLIGSVTDKLLRAASCPVLVVPAQKGK
jgi:nucleotide-binding universal stress UspA family protein